MKLAALVSVSLLCLCAWCGDGRYFVTSLEHAGGDHYNLTFRIITTVKEREDMKPISVEDVKAFLKKDYPENFDPKDSWYINSRTYSLQNGVKAEFKEEGKQPHSFSALLTKSRGERVSIECQLWQTLSIPPLDEDKEEKVVQKQNGWSGTLELKPGETEVSGRYNIPKSENPK